MKKVIIIFMLFLKMWAANSQVNEVVSRNDSIAPELIQIKNVVNLENNSKDSIVKQNLIKQSTDLIVKSLFGQSKKLSNADSIINRFDAMPSFGIFKNNYFVLGTEMLSTPTQLNSDAKFQVSIRQRLTNSTLPFKTFLFMTYSQKSFWGIFQESLPFIDLNFNPSVGIGKALIHDNRYLGNLIFHFEHESNGKSGPDSRSWNRITLGSNFVMNDNWSITAKVWIPIIDSPNNKDIVKYTGWCETGIDYATTNRKFRAGLTMLKRGGANLNSNIIVNLAGRMFSDDDQYLFLEYYNGYGESLLNYKQYSHKIRIGIVFKPDFFVLH